MATRDSRAARIPEPVAIVGIGCRFPGGNGPEAFWRSLCQGVDSIRETPPHRWDAASFHHSEQQHPGAAATRWGGFVDLPPGAFDARFFGMSPREAAHLDPMQAWLLEVAWESLEDAGIPPSRLAGSRTAVFVGVFTEDAKIHQMRESNRGLLGLHSGTGTAMTMASNRISYWFDFRGPSVSIDTACSSSLVAIHLACQSIWNGEADLALAGGVNAMFQPEFTIAESKAGMLSPDGRCKTFDSRANGYVRGEGAGILVLKPLSRALADGDDVVAVIRATATNQDGRTPGITVPSADAQMELARAAFERAGLDPSKVAYIEAHGTGTPVGDPIEARALGEVFGAGRPGDERCWVGSVKTNIGHLEAAAGVAGVIKAALCLKHGAIPPHLHLEEPNPNIDFDALKLRVPRALTPLPRTSEPAVVAVNSFGFGGSNAHAVLSQAPSPSIPVARPQLPELLTISARTEVSLQGLVASYRALAHASSERENDPPLGELARAMARRRDHHPHRLAVVADSYRALAEVLEVRAQEMARPRRAVTRSELAFVYTGMGPQWWAMGRALLLEEPVFRQAIEQCDSILGRWSSWSLLSEMRADEARSRMNETQISQPANFAVQVGLTELLRSWGITPGMVVGHSTGEVASFWSAGVLSLEQACKVTFHRSRLQHRTSGQGKLMAVGLPYEEALEAIAGLDGVSIAAVNGPSSVTLAGDPAVLEQITAPLAEKGVFCRLLKVEVPFHSHYMDPLRGELLEVLADLEPKVAAIPLFSTVTGHAAEGPELDAAYWWRNVRDPVRFALAIEGMIARGARAFLEVGPHPALRNNLLECAEKQGVPVSTLATLRRDGNDRVNLLDAVGALYMSGFDPDWNGLYPTSSAAVKLPAYTWEHDIHFIESAESRQDRLGTVVHPLLGRRRMAPQPTWQASLGRRSPSYLEDHAIQGAVIFPGAGYIEMGLAALRETTDASSQTVEFHDIQFRSAMFLREAPQIVRTTFDREDLRFTVHARASATDEHWETHASGHVALVRRAANSRAARTLAGLRASFEGSVVHDGAACYRLLTGQHFEYGPRFQGVRQLFARGHESLAQVELESMDGEDAMWLPPPLLDACFHGFLTAGALERGSQDVYLPVEVARLRVFKPLRGRLWVHGRSLEANRQSMFGNIDVYSDDGELLVAIEGIRLQALDAASASGAFENLFYAPRWTEIESPAPSSEDRAGRWLLFADAQGVASALAARIEQAGGTAILVHPKPDLDFDRSLAHARADRIVHLGSLDAPDMGSLTAPSLMDAQEHGVESVLRLVQALERAGADSPPRLWLVTRGARTLAEDRAAPAIAQSPLWGFATALFQQEHPELAGGVVDLDPKSGPEGAGRLFDLLAAPPLDYQLAIRDGRLFADRLAPAPEIAEQALPVRLRSDATYVITGGRGGLGLVFAHALIRRGARRLVLMGRTVLPAREQWHAVDPATAEGKQIAAIAALERLGASIHAEAVDIVDPEQVRAFAESFRRQAWPPIRGIIQAAGVLTPMRFSDLTVSKLRGTMAPKLAGTWNLHTLLTDAPLDFFVLFSSVTSLGFSLGVVDYASANAFLDGFAHARRHAGEHALSVNWGSWSDVGMASDESTIRDLGRRGFLSIRPEEGIEALDRCLTHDPTQITVIGADWSRLFRMNYPTAAPPPMLLPIVQHLEESAAAHAPAEGAATDDVRTHLAQSTDDDARREIVERFLHATIAGSLRLSPDKIDREQSLHDLGLDSILAVELRHQISSGLGAGPTIIELLQGGSIASLAQRLLPRIPLAAPREEATPADHDFEKLAAELSALSQEESRALLASVQGDSPS